MPPTINWLTKVITIPKTDTTLVSAGPPEIRELNVDTFRLNLKDIEDSDEGMPFLDTHRHNEPVTVGGVTLARVVEIINGYTITFENGSYAVNLNGANNNIGDVLNLNNVQVRSNNSAGLTFSKQVEDQSFEGARIYINTVGQGQPGTQFPIGTPGSPVDNLSDAQAIIANRGLPKRLFLRGDLTVGAAESVEDYDILGAGPHGLSKLILTTGATTTNSVIRSCEIQGDITGPITALEISSLTSLVDFEGAIVGGGLSGTITLANVDAENRIEFINCHSRVAGLATPIIDCSNLPNLELNIRGYHGGLEIRNFSLSSMEASIDIDSGHLILDSTCTAGTIVVRGQGKITNNSVGTTVNIDGFIEGWRVRLAEEILHNNYTINTTNGVMTITLDDGTTITSTAYKDSAQTIPFDGTGAILARDKFV